MVLICNRRKGDGEKVLCPAGPGGNFTPVQQKIVLDCVLAGARYSVIARQLAKHEHGKKSAQTSTIMLFINTYGGLKGFLESKGVAPADIMKLLPIYASYAQNRKAVKK